MRILLFREAERIAEIYNEVPNEIFDAYSVSDLSNNNRLSVPNIGALSASGQSSRSGSDAGPLHHAGKDLTVVNHRRFQFWF